MGNYGGKQGEHEGSRTNAIQGVSDEALVGQSSSDTVKHQFSLKLNERDVEADREIYLSDC